MYKMVIIKSCKYFQREKTFFATEKCKMRCAAIFLVGVPTLDRGRLLGKPKSAASPVVGSRVKGNEKSRFFSFAFCCFRPFTFRGVASMARKGKRKCADLAVWLLRVLILRGALCLLGAGQNRRLAPLSHPPRGFQFAIPSQPIAIRAPTSKEILVAAPHQEPIGRIGDLKQVFGLLGDSHNQDFSPHFQATTTKMEGARCENQARKRNSVVF